MDCKRRCRSRDVAPLSCYHARCVDVFVEDGKECRSTCLRYPREQNTPQRIGYFYTLLRFPSILGGIPLEIRPIWSNNVFTFYPLLSSNRKILIDVGATKCLWPLGDLSEAVPLYVVPYFKLR